jgi:thiol-disulfide isomerase/thioredoxin
MNVREAALAGLQSAEDPALTALAAAQLEDHDPQVRLLGLQYLKRAPAGVGVPLIVPLLDDGDPFFVTMSLKRLENWSGQDFGVKLSGTAPVANPETGLKEFRDGSHARAGVGVELAKEWWSNHQSEFSPVQLEVSKEALAARKPLPAGDFVLPSLDGDRVKLSDFRGQVVLINFWTTWCTACVSEMPELIELQKRHAGRLAILGISLDYVPDSHGHIGGHAAVEEQSHSEGHHDDDELRAEALNRIREKVARTVNARGINYTILLDEFNAVGGRFNGGELPTTVIVDADGHVRRRFVGSRSLPVFEAMIAEASVPLPMDVRE